MVTYADGDVRAGEAVRPVSNALEIALGQAVRGVAEMDLQR